MPGPYFTPEEANALLPTLRPLVKSLLAARQQILARQPEVWPVLEHAAGNGGNRAAAELVAEFETIERCTKQIRVLGVLLKDLNTGLIDFLAQRDGRDIYLCWRYDEPQVAHWHTLEGGFAGRRPL